MRAAVFAAAVVAAVSFPASPAAAHGGGGSDATNFLSSVVERSHPDLQWEVIAGDSLLRLRNDSGREVVIAGYQEEPYLRFAPDGDVFENRRSPAAYLNRDRFAEVELPSEVDHEAEPRWARIAGGSTHAWHDHRIHWMSQDEPPPVAARPGETVEVQRWTVPYTVGGASGEVRGVLRYVPGDPWWPWVAGAGVLLALPALLAVGVRRSRLTPRRIARTGAVVIGVLFLADAVHLVDDLVAVPATFSQNLSAGLYGGAFLVAAAAAAVAAWRSKDPTLALVLGGLALVFGFGVSHLAQLTSSQLATVLPEAFTRALVAANLAVVIPLAVLVVGAERRARARPSEHAGAQGSPS